MPKRDYRNRDRNRESLQRKDAFLGDELHRLRRRVDEGGGGGGGVSSVTGSAPIASSGGSTPDISLNNNGVTDAKLRDSAATSVIGRSANSVGDPGDIAAAADGDVLRRSAGVLGFGAIPQASVTNLASDLAGKAASVHSHAISDTTGLQTALDAKLDDSQASAFGLSLLDDADAAAGRATLGAAAAAHTHGLADITDEGALASKNTIATADIDNDAVTHAKYQNIASDRLLGRDTAAAGDPEELTVGGGLEFTGSGGVQRSALTGDVTAPAGSGATTIANDAVTLAKLANIATARLLGRVTAGAGDPEELTGTQATTLLDVFTSLLKGLVPASGGGTTNYLRADGNWAAPSGGGGGGSFALTTVERDLGLTAYSGSFDITGLSGLTPGNIVLVQQLAEAYTGKGTLRDEIEMDPIVVSGYVVDATTIRCHWSSVGAISGNVKFGYAVSA